MKRAIAVTTLAALAAWGCHDPETTLVTDTGSDPGPADTAVSDPGAEPAVPSCTSVADWELVASEQSDEPGSVTVRVDLDSTGVTSGCAGSPCLVVTVSSGDGTVSDVTQLAPGRATFVYTDEEADAGDAAQLLLRWRVLCTDGTGSEERTVTSPVWICSPSPGELTPSDDSC
jgi:hypothetical protein